MYAELAFAFITSAFAAHKYAKPGGLRPRALWVAGAFGGQVASAVFAVVAFSQVVGR